MSSHFDDLELLFVVQGVESLIHLGVPDGLAFARGVVFRFKLLSTFQEALNCLRIGEQGQGVVVFAAFFQLVHATLNSIVCAQTLELAAFSVSEHFVVDFRFQLSRID